MAEPTPRMESEAIEAALKMVPEWSLAGEAIQRTYQFADFKASMRFVNSVAEAAEATQHHPDFLIRYSRVTLTLATHDANGITPKDFALAAKSDELAAPLLPAPVAKAPPKAPAKAGSKKK